MTLPINCILGQLRRHYKIFVIKVSTRSNRVESSSVRRKWSLAFQAGSKGLLNLNSVFNIRKCYIKCCKCFPNNTCSEVQNFKINGRLYNYMQQLYKLYVHFIVCTVYMYISIYISSHIYLYISYLSIYNTKDSACNCVNTS